MIADEGRYLTMSGLQSYAYCPRQWALRAVERAHGTTPAMEAGKSAHRRAHDGRLREKRGNLLVARGLHVSTRALMLDGVCDVVEFHADQSGTRLLGEDRLWVAVPVEYKIGRAKPTDCDRLQLAAQAIALEEMLCHDVPVGYVYHKATRSREEVHVDSALRARCRDLAAEMHALADQGSVPQARRGSRCKGCSMAGECLPARRSAPSVGRYMEEMLA